MSEALGIVSDDAVFFKEIVEDHPETELFHFELVDDHGLGALRAVFPGDVGRYGLAICDNAVDKAAGDMMLDGAEMIGKSIARCLSRLGHEVRDVYARGFRTCDGLGYFRDEQIRKNAGIERSGAQEN